MSVIGRRAFIQQIAATALSAAALAGQPPQRARRPATVEWAAAETIFAIGGTPIATASPYRMQQGVTTDLEIVPGTGSIFTPDLETLQALHPDLIFCASWQAGLVPVLSKIAPVHLFDLRNPSDTQFDNTVRLTAEIGDLIGRQDEARLYQLRAQNLLDQLRASLHPVADRPILIGALGPDGRHLSIYGKGGLFDSVLARLGLKNAWTGPMNAWGNVTQGIEVLADYPNTPFLYLDAGPPTVAAAQALASSSLWNDLPSVRRGAVRSIPFAWLYGGLPTCLRFGRSVAAVLLETKHDDH